jgi:uncharacterized protein YkwD
LLLALFACDDASSDRDSGGDDTGEGSGTLDADADADSDGDSDADTDGDSDGDSDADTDADADLAEVEACHESARDWPLDWAELERQVLAEINARRTAGDSCPDRAGGVTAYPPMDPLEMEPHLQCAARVHTLWMAENGTMTHESPGGPIGDDLSERVQTAGYTGRGVAENIAQGHPTPEAVVEGWMGSPDGHCTSIMNSRYTIIGVGYAAVDTGSQWIGGDYWTADFGS